VSTRRTLQTVCDDAEIERLIKEAMQLNASE
jgi:hypothetical protein